MAENPPDKERHKARLRWLCRRGMKELDVLLTRYIDTCYSVATLAEQAAFARLLEYQDPELYDLILGTGNTDDPDENQVLGAIRQYASH